MVKLEEEARFKQDKIGDGSQDDGLEQGDPSLRTIFDVNLYQVYH